MLEPMQKLIKEKYLNIQAKLIFPLAVTILLLVVVLSPLTNRLINNRIEQEADRRLSEIANSVGALIQNSETLVRNHAALLANQPELQDRKSTRLNSSHSSISYAVFCLKK